MNTTTNNYTDSSDLFEKADIAGRGPLINLLKQMGMSYRQTERYAKADVLFEDKNGTVYQCEIKNRNEKYRSYKTHMIELPKLEYLLSQPNPLYANIFGRYIYLYGRKSLEKATTAHIYRPKYTVIASSSNDSACAEIPSSLATIYYLDETTNKYIRVNS